MSPAGARRDREWSLVCRGMLTGGAGGVNTIRRMSRGIAFLTGGTGFVGGHVARALGSEGWSVRALARRPEALAGSSWAAAALDVVAGDPFGISGANPLGPL